MDIDVASSCQTRQTAYSFPATQLSWNAGAQPCRILEIISPAGFEQFFAEVVAIGGVLAADPELVAELCARYELEMRPDTIPGLVERFDLRFPGDPIA